MPKKRSLLPALKVSTARAAEHLEALARVAAGVVKPFPVASEADPEWPRNGLLSLHSGLG